MKILITGGAGNIGRELTRRCISGGNEVVIFDIPEANYEGLDPPITRLAGLKGLTIVKGSVIDTDAVNTAVKGVDAVIHLAALMPHLCTDREETMSVNVNGTKAVLDALDRQGRSSIRLCLIGFHLRLDAGKHPTHQNRPSIGAHRFILRKQDGGGKGAHGIQHPLCHFTS